MVWLASGIQLRLSFFVRTLWAGVGLELIPLELLDLLELLGDLRIGRYRDLDLLAPSSLLCLQPRLPLSLRG